MMAFLLLVLFAIYLVIGYFVVRHDPSIYADGEVLGALMILWPALLLGRLANRIKFVQQYPIFKYVFTIVIALAVTVLLFLYAAILFGKV